MAGAMDMAGKLPKIRDEERENRVRIYMPATNFKNLDGEGAPVLGYY